MRFCDAKSCWVRSLLAAFVLLAATAPASAQGRIEFDELPQHVQAVVRDRFADAEILEATHFNEDGVVGFEVIIEHDDRVLGVILAQDGKIEGVWRPDDGAEEEDERAEYEGDEEAFEEDEWEEVRRWEGRPVAFTPTYVRRASDDLGLGVERIVFVKRHTYVSSHFYTDFIDGCDRYGGNLCVLSLGTGRVRELVPELADGIFGRYDLSFDARRIVFDWKRCDEEGFRIYEVGVDGRGLRQLTFPPKDEAERIAKYDNSFLGETAQRYNHHTDDMHPCYLPDGGICFTSTRCEYGTLCDAPDILTTTVLYRMDADGRNMVKLTNSAVSEFSPSIMDDGRILYTRWEYVDKGQLGVKCLWAMCPDGTKSVEIYGNDIPFPPTMLHGRQIPGRANLFVMLGTPHFPQSGIGTVIRVDTSRDIRTAAPMTYVTPYVDVQQEAGWNQYADGRWRMRSRGPLYMDPYPLSATQFLVAHNHDRDWDEADAYDLYLLDDKGNHTLIYDDAEISCWQPMPLRPRTKPPVLPSQRNPKLARRNQAACVVQDVHRGLAGVERGTVKYLRIMEQLPRPWDARHFWDQHCEYTGHSLLSLGSVLGVKVMHGIVPVYEDGSAHFLVPADRNIYFQALDEDYLEVQRERTYVNYRPGETRSCVGCHERPGDVPADDGRMPIALTKPASLPGPQPGDATAARAIHYPTDVQPVLDRHCVRCHGADEPADDLDLSSEMTEHFCLSYERLIERDLIETRNEGSGWDGTEYLPPYSLGSGVSRLVEVLREGHEGVELSREEMLKITTWIDANGQYYGSYYGRKHIRFRSHPYFRPAPTFEQAVSTTAPLPVDQR